MAKKAARPKLVGARYVGAVAKITFVTDAVFDEDNGVLSVTKRRLVFRSGVLSEMEDPYTKKVNIKDIVKGFKK